MPVLHRLLQSAGVVSQKTGGSAAVCHGVLGTVAPLRPQPRRHGRSAASRPAEVGARAGCSVHLGKVRLKRGLRGVFDEELIQFLLVKKLLLLQFDAQTRGIKHRSQIHSANTKLHDHRAAC